MVKSGNAIRSHHYQLILTNGIDIPNFTPVKVRLTWQGKVRLLDSVVFWSIAHVYS
jgi:hypothetical protein